jgi:hypothetical protein
VNTAVNQDDDDWFRDEPALSQRQVESGHCGTSVGIGRVLKARDTYVGGRSAMHLGLTKGMTPSKIWHRQVVD